MQALAIDTSHHYLSLAVCNQDQCFEYHEQVGQQQTERLLPELEKLLTSAQIGWNELDAIVYSQGPGTFTGLRVGAGIAKGLAFAHHLPLMPIPTLDAIAVQLPASVLVAIDARMKEVYWRCYTIEQDQFVPQGDIIVSNPLDIKVPAGNWLGAGSGFLAYQDILPASLLSRFSALYKDIQPRASAYLTLANHGHYPLVDALEADLLYVRNKVALTLNEQKAQRHGKVF